jgi:hypothetical protein
MNANDYQAWEGTVWTIRWTDPLAPAGVAQNDKIQFTGGKIQHLDSTGQPADWALSYTVGSDGLEGTTVVGTRPFCIRYDAGTDEHTEQLTCYYVQDTQSRLRRGRAVALSAVSGILIGAAAGVAGGRPLAGALVGLVAAVIGSVITVAATNPGDRITASGTWVADDGPDTRPVVLPAIRVVGS